MTQEKIKCSEAVQNERWYVVSTRVNFETAASQNLQNQRFRVFHPRQRRTVRHARQLKTKLKPLFPGYLFVQMNEAAVRWRSINGTYGVVSLLCAGDKPIPVPCGWVEALMQKTDCNDVVSFEQGLAEGQSVRVVEGPFVEQIGQIQRVEGCERVRILLDVMQGQVPVSLRRDQVMPA